MYWTKNVIQKCLWNIKWNKLFAVINCYNLANANNGKLNIETINRTRMMEMYYHNGYWKIIVLFITHFYSYTHKSGLNLIINN